MRVLFKVTRSTIYRHWTLWLSRRWPWRMAVTELRPWDLLWRTSRYMDWRTARLTRPSKRS